MKTRFLTSLMILSLLAPCSAMAGQNVTAKIADTLDKTNDSISTGFRARTYLTLVLAPLASVNSETLVGTFVKNANGTTTSSVGSYTITNGKTLHVTHIGLSTRSTSATAVLTTSFFLRNNTAGATTTASALVGQWECSASPIASAVDGQDCVRDIALGDYGLMLVGDGTNSIGMSRNSSATTGLDGITIIGYEDSAP